jgi:nicotinamide-nucleotide amidase
VNVSTLSIGDELLWGEVVDTNSAVIGERLAAAGLRPAWHLRVGDNEKEIEEAIAFLARRSDAVIVTGGLGPTLDDLTVRAAARATRRQLILNDEALEHLQQLGERLGGNFIALNEKQALLPAKATLIPNPVGTACGFHLDLEGCTLLFLPGVPAEMSRMLTDTVLPFLTARAGRTSFSASTAFKVFGRSEAEFDAMVGEFHRPADGVSIAFRVLFPEIFIKVRADGPPGPALANLYERTVADLRRALGDCLYAEGEETLPQVTAGLLLRSRQTVTTAESCTGGLLAKLLTDIPGSSAFFQQGMVTYADSAKTNLLGVSRELIRSRGAVSSEVAAEMARGARKAAGSTLALAVTGIAGPDGGTAAKPVGTVFIALAHSEGCQTTRHYFRGSREEIRSITAFTALDILRRHLLSSGDRQEAGSTLR